MARYILKRQLFSIEEGKYTGNRKSYDPRWKSGLKGAASGAAVGGISGAAIGLLPSIADGDFTPTLIGGLAGGVLGAVSGAFAGFFESHHDSKGDPTNVSKLISKVRDFVADEEGISYNPESSSTSSVTIDDYGNQSRTVSSTSNNDYKAKYNIAVDRVFKRYCDVDGDPKRSDITVSCKGHDLAIYLYKVDGKDLRSINKTLDSYCELGPANDYTSKEIKKGIYLINMECENDETIFEIVESFIKYGLRVNILYKMIKNK